MIPPQPVEIIAGSPQMAAYLAGQHRQCVIEIIQGLGLGVDDYFSSRFNLSPFLEKSGWESGRDPKGGYRVASATLKLVFDSLSQACPGRHQYEMSQFTQRLECLILPPGAYSCLGIPTCIPGTVLGPRSILTAPPAA
jgi:hypothetical protein